ncbi:hypothetical protein GCM10009677_28050 [Sphaerisporangium rubeum]
MPIDDDLVPNPKYTELEATLAIIRSHVQVLETVLDPVCSQFGSQAIWVGPTARTFEQELSGRNARIKTVARRVVEELEAELRSTPSEVSRATASALIGWG